MNIIFEINMFKPNGSVSVVTHKLIELNKTCIDAILNAFSTVLTENRRNKVFT